MKMNKVEMKVRKRAGIMMLAGTILMTQMSVSAAVKTDNAVVNSVGSYSQILNQNMDWSNLGSSWGSSTGSWGSNWGGNNSGWNFGNWGNWGGSSQPDPEPESQILPAPHLKEVRYVHYDNKKNDHLIVTWDPVEGAVLYEMVIQKTYGGEKTYTTDYPRMSILGGSDSMVSGCIRGAQIRVRAIDEKGQEGEWSEWRTVGCNAIGG